MTESGKEKQMTNDSIEEKALELLNVPDWPYEYEPDDHPVKVLCRALEAHEAFKQEVSDAVGKAQTPTEILCQCARKHVVAFNRLDQFIIPKPQPDPLVEIMEVLNGEWTPDEYAQEIRTALDALGFEIREKGQ
jgi:hypothetical protein